MEVIQERLDHCFCNGEWLQNFPDSKVTNFPIINSDHGLMLLDTKNTSHFVRRPYRFEEMWMSHPQCEEIIKQAWSNQIKGSEMYALMSKIKLTKI